MDEDPDAEAVEEPVFVAVDPEPAPVAVIFPVETVLFDPAVAVEVLRVVEPVAEPEPEIVEDAEVELLAVLFLGLC